MCVREILRWKQAIVQGKWSCDKAIALKEWEYKLCHYSVFILIVIGIEAL